MPQADQHRRGGAPKIRKIRIGQGDTAYVLHIAIVPKTVTPGGHRAASRPSGSA
jgi:hypothetical protein